MKQFILKILRLIPQSLLSKILNNLFILKSIINKNTSRNGYENNNKVTSEFPVDIVYTWVDSSDSSWLKKKNQYSNDVAYLPKDSDVASRYRENDELKYSLRSVLLYANWVRTIYIVTDNQIPHWYKKFDDRVKFVSHDDIFPDKSDLPSFNSHAIEANLHRIKGLSENFIYFNDDFFLRSPVLPSDFFTEDGSKSKFFWSEQVFIPQTIDEDSVPVDISAHNNAVFLEKNYGHVTDRKFKHIPMALKISTIKQLEYEHPEIFASTSAAKFRSESDYSIISALIHHYGYALDKALPSSLPYLYASFDDKLFEFKMNLLLMFRFKCFCINDVEVDDKVLRHISNTFTDKIKLLFPEPSPYEIDENNEKNQ